MRRLVQIILTVAALSALPGVAPAADQGMGRWLRTHLDDGDWADDIDREHLSEFYQARHFKPVWVSQDRLGDKGRTWRNVLFAARDEGLNPKEYHQDAIVQLLRKRDAKNLARLELLLTDAFFRYGVEVRVGYQFPRAVDPDWYIQPDTVEPVALLREVLKAKDFSAALKALPPAYDEYRRLRTALRHYRRLMAQGDWPVLPNTAALHPGDWHPQVATLRERLEREGYLRARADANAFLFDIEVEGAVSAFQRTHGFRGDGVVGRGTRAALNISLPERIAEIEKNMERWRWMPRELPSRYVMVNMADYKLKLVEKNKIEMEMKVVIGKDYRATPVFNDKIQYIELNPVWNVPPRIARDDLLPKQQQDPDFFARKGIRVFTSWRADAEEIDPEEIDWEDVDPQEFPYKLQQEAGPSNSLGRMKFIFPNNFRVYLHDTPARHLFERRVRTFSSGCIRLEKPVELAAKLLQDVHWKPRAIEDALASGETQKVVLAKPMPIYLLYWTAWVDDNRVNFRDDIYGRNRALPDQRLYVAAERSQRADSSSL